MSSFLAGNFFFLGDSLHHRTPFFACWLQVSTRPAPCCPLLHLRHLPEQVPSTPDHSPKQAGLTRRVPGLIPKAILVDYLPNSFLLMTVFCAPASKRQCICTSKYVCFWQGTFVQLGQRKNSQTSRSEWNSCKRWFDKGRLQRSPVQPEDDE